MMIFVSKKLSFFILFVLPLSISIVGIFTSVNYFLIVGPVYLTISLFYGIYPIRYSTFQYFTERGFSNVLADYQYIKTIVYIEIPIVIVITIVTFSYVSLNPNSSPVPIFFIQGTPNNIALISDPNYRIFAPLNTFAYSIIAGVLWITIQNRKKDFKFYFAKAYFQVITNNRDKSKHVVYLIKGIRAYDSYLRRNLNLQINTEEVYSKIISNYDIDIDKAILEISKSFENQNDKLKPIRVISKIVNSEETKMLFQESLGEKIKDLVAFLTGIIGTIIAIFQYLLAIATKL